MVTSTLIGQLMTVIQPFLDEQNAKIASLEAQLVEKVIILKAETLFSHLTDLWLSEYEHNY